MKRNMISIVYLISGALSAIIATFYRFLITSDIPVSYTISEGLTVQIMFAISTVFFLFALISLESYKRTIFVGVIFSLIFFFDILIFRIHIGADYYDSSYAQLQLSSLINFGIVMLFSYYLTVKIFRTKRLLH